ncbi:hypothetical protein PENTCL1PPCAC_18772, partial [Pristionchus entomophagus]
SIVVYAIFHINFASANDYSICTTYTDLDAAAPCGENGYALNFGYPICRAFIDNEWKFTTDGQAFLNCVRSCLTDFIRTDIITKNVTDCTAINNDAFSSHLPCYTRCNFCDVVLRNILPFALTYQISNFLSVNAIEQVAAVAIQCLSNLSNCLLG